MRYTFKSHSGRIITIEGNIHEELARKAAMRHLWGLPNNTWCDNLGSGLDMIPEPEAKHEVRVVR